MDERVTDAVGGTADEQLARLVVTDLVRAGVITSEQGKKLLPKVLAGEATSEEWRALFELARPASSEGRRS